MARPKRGVTPGGAGAAHGARLRATPGARALRRASGARRAATRGRATPGKAAAPTRAPRPARTRAGRVAPKPPARAARRRTRFAPPEPARVAALIGILERLYPEATTALRHENPLQLLVATILSAQCTDERVNQVTPVLFERYPDAAALAASETDELESMIRSTGFYRMKAKAIRACTADIVSKFGGQVPRTMDELLTLRGVGRKTANVVLGNAFGIPGLVVDTHVQRLSARLGLTHQKDPVKIEFALQPIVPQEKWTWFSHWLILHGRSTCVARKPRCSICPLAPHCPRVGVTASQ
jgi:endonuclease-3